MAGAAYPCGVTVSPSTFVGDINSMDLPLKIDTSDTTVFLPTGDADQGFKKSTSTLIGMQGKFSGFRKGSDAGQNALRTAMLTRTPVTVIVLLEEAGETWTFPIIVTGFGPKGDVGGVKTLDIDWTMNGALVIDDGD